MKAQKLFQDASGSVVFLNGQVFFKPKQSQPEMPIGGVKVKKRSGKSVAFRRVAPSVKLAARWAKACKTAGVSVPLRVWESA